MGFDDEVDEVKREMQTAKLDPQARRETAAKLCQRLKEQINSKRLDFAVGEDNGDPIVHIKYKPDNEKLASVYVNEDGSITFQAAGATDAAEEEEEDAGYFPSYVEYMDEEEFLEDAYDMLKVGIAEFELRHGSSDRCYLASDIHAGPLALHAPVQRIDGSGANPYDHFVVLRNRLFEVLHFEDLSRFVLGVDGSFHVG